MLYIYLIGAIVRRIASIILKKKNETMKYGYTLIQQGIIINQVVSLRIYQVTKKILLETVRIYI